MYKSRPKIQPKLSKADKIAEFTGYIVLLIFWVGVVYSYSTLPDIIVTHYNGAGDADGYGDKEAIFGLPAVATVLFILLTFFGRRPHLYNYAIEINPDNALKQYTIATRMLRYLKLIVIVIFGLIAYETITTANSNDQELSEWFLPVFFMGIFIFVTIFLIKSVNAEK